MPIAHDRAMRVSSILLLSLLVAVLPASLRADVQITPYAGVAFGGDAGNDAWTYGGSLAFMGDLIGFEVDGAYTSDFFGPGDFEGFTTEDNVTTLMGNLVVGPRFADGRGRIFGTLGAGLVKTSVRDEDDFFDVDSNDLGFSAGAGLSYFLGEHIGLRGDVRYFRDLQDPERDDEFDVDLGDLDYWRGTVGLSLRF
jgi:opacity protein-like surface antigen